jgi:hypothetical protein
MISLREWSKYMKIKMKLKIGRFIKLRFSVALSITFILAWLGQHFS